MPDVVRITLQFMLVLCKVVDVISTYSWQILIFFAVFVNLYELCLSILL
jgi:hypothetical protein